MPVERMSATLLLAFITLGAPCIAHAASATPAQAAQDFTSAPWNVGAGWALAPVVPQAAAEFVLAPTVQTLAPVPAGSAAHSTPLRTVLADFAITLRDIRYRRGGRDPASGFDCSGFVRYVFRHSLGQDLPVNSASQYRVGSQVARDAMMIGDLVFFRIKGKRISHVGIYLGDGRFIHSPSSGKRVSISRLDERYWSKRFAGAKRPGVLT